jgi:predicted NUDIX family NTP pyrophosphohydrolase
MWWLSGKPVGPYWRGIDMKIWEMPHGLEVEGHKVLVLPRGLEVDGQNMFVLPQGLGVLPEKFEHLEAVGIW